MNAELLRTQVAAPLRIDSADSIGWNGETDIAVVGYGAAGACAALEAAEQGAHVCVLDRLNGGGASALSGGVVYAGGGTEFQRRAGETDSVENMLEYLRHETTGVVSERTLRRFCSDSITNLEWLQQHGVPFDSTAYDKKTSYPPEGYFLYYSGNELCAPYRDTAQPARRGHRVKGDNFTGRVLFNCLHRAVLGRGNISVETHCEVSRLILDSNGRVLGLEYLQAPQVLLIRKLMYVLNSFANRFVVLEPRLGNAVRRLVHWLRRRGNTRRLRVNKGVILSAGGFIFQRQLVQQYAPDYLKSRPLGEDCNGSGIALGASAGGAVDHMQRVSAWRFFAPPDCLLKGIVIDTHGRRICNEDLYGATTADRVMAAGGRAFLILDEALMCEARAAARPGRMPWHQWLPARLFLHASVTRSSDLATLAQRCGFDSVALKDTLDSYNAGAAVGRDALGKAGHYLQPLGPGPYYAIDISLHNSRVPCPAITLGGLVVDEDSGAVLNEEGEAIRGLYAAGRNAVGICSHSYISGLSLADCVFSGRRAGSSAAEATKNKLEVVDVA